MVDGLKGPNLSTADTRDQQQNRFFYLSLHLLYCNSVLFSCTVRIPEIQEALLTGLPIVLTYHFSTPNFSFSMDRPQPGVIQLNAL